MSRRGRAPEPVECCDVCVGNRQLLEQLRADVAALAEQLATVPRAKAVHVHDGDTIVLTAGHELSEAAWDQLGTWLRDQFPRAKVISIMAPGVDIDVLHPTDDAAGDPS